MDARAFSGSGTPPPAPWDYGLIGLEGPCTVNYSVYDGSFTLTTHGGGLHTGGTSDGFSYVMQQVSENIVIEARVVTFSPGLQVGVTIRQNFMAPGTLHATALFTSESATGARFLWRDTNNAPAHHDDPAIPGNSKWLVVIRQGDSIAAFVSSAEKWTDDPHLLGAETVAFAEPYCFGLVVAHPGGGSGAATFSSVTSKQPLAIR